ncbi:MAG: hypothetical protein IKY56_05995 [Alistipes sp.]|nr:hypothetical protein [Alistipes sp.]
MRLIKFLAILVLGMVSSVFVCNAQYDSYYKPDNGLTVTTKPNAELYPLPESYHAAVASGEAFSYGVRDVVKLGDDKPKVVRKPQTLNVMRYTNIAKKESFDAYIVEYKEKLWVLSEEHVTQNDALVARSTKLANYGDDLKQRYQAKHDRVVELNGQNASTKRELDSLIDKFSATCRDSIEYYRELKSRLPHLRDSLIAQARAQEQARVDEEYNKWYNSLPASTRAALGAIEITYSELDTPNSVGGCDYTLAYVNKSPKTIKYLYWTGDVYNAVDDIVPCDISGYEDIKGKDTGPVYEGQESGGTWECVIYNYTARYMVLTKIQIIYMDGSTLSFTGDDLYRMKSEPSRDVYVDTAEVTSHLVSESFYQGKINYWNGILWTLKNKTSYKGFWSELNDSKYNELVGSISTLAKQISGASAEASDAKAKVENFEKFVGYRIYATPSKTSYASKSSAGGTTAQTYTTTTKSPFVTFGLEGSIEGLKSFSTGVGVIMRIGRYNSLFNATVGVKYQYTTCSNEINYQGSGGLGNLYHPPTDPSWDVIYEQNAHEVVIPAILNLNVSRGDDIAFLLGVGYEYGISFSQKATFQQYTSYFDESKFWQIVDASDLKHLSIPTRAVVLQVGFGSRECDWKFYYKIYTNKSKYVNGTPGAIGTSMTIYF